jgi:osmoprotectant transport system ATP-binding protein
LPPNLARCCPAARVEKGIDTVIELIDVSKRYGDTLAIDHVTLRIVRGELAIIVGESGSGKTTLLKMLNRLIEPDSGEVRIDGRDVRSEDAVALRRRTGYVIQQVGLMPHLTVADNIATVPRLMGWPSPEITHRVNELLELVGLPAATYRERYPDELSGGQRQRVGIARAVAARPQVLLLDEPFGALDPITRAAQQSELRRIHQELKLTSIMVTHDLIEALTLADRIAVMLRGALVQLATPAELMAAPANAYVASLVDMARSHGEKLRAILP